MLQKHARVKPSASDKNKQEEETSQEESPNNEEVNATHSQEYYQCNRSCSVIQTSFSSLEELELHLEYFHPVEYQETVSNGREL